MIEASNEFLSKQRLLVLSPHADDEAFGCAGTIAKIKKLGGEVYIMLFSVGDLAQYDAQGKIVKGSVREAEFRQTAELLGVDAWEIIYRDAQTHLRLDTIPRREMIHVIEQTSSVSLEKIRPTIVALPAVSYNQDHCAVFHAGFTACRPGTPGLKYFPPIVLVYDNPTLFWNMEREKFHANFYVDISDFLQIKLKALSMHESQRKPPLHHCSQENLENLVKLRGREISVEAAEAFTCLRFVL